MSCIAVQAELSITIESMSFSEHSPRPPDGHKQRYLETMCQYYNLINCNYGNMWRQLNELLNTCYGCVTLLSRTEGPLVLKLTLNSVKLVRFQVDAANGSLQSRLNNILVTDKVLGYLRLNQLVINVDAKIT